MKNRDKCLEKYFKPSRNVVYEKYIFSIHLCDKAKNLFKVNSQD